MYLCLDIGGTNCRVAIFDQLENPNLLGIVLFPHAGDYKMDLENLLLEIQRLTLEPCQGISIGLPGILTDDKSSLAIAPNLPSWEHQPIKTDFAQAFHCPVVLENDVALSARGEAFFGHGMKKDFLFLSWGTGIGGAMVNYLGNEPFLSPFEPGHMIVNWNGEVCHCGQKGCWELTCGGAALSRHFSSDLEVLTDGQWDEIILNFSKGLLNILLVRPVNLVILGGGISLKNTDKIEKIKTLIQSQLKIYPMPEIKISKLGESAGSYGGIAKLRR